MYSVYIDFVRSDQIIVLGFLKFSNLFVLGPNSIFSIYQYATKMLKTKFYRATLRRNVTKA